MTCEQKCVSGGLHRGTGDLSAQVGVLFRMLFSSEAAARVQRLLG